MISSHAPAAVRLAACGLVPVLSLALAAQDPLPAPRATVTSTPQVLQVGPLDTSTLPAVSKTRVVVRFQHRVATAQLDDLLAPVRARVAEVGHGDAFHVLEVPAGTAGLWAAWLEAQNGVIYAEPDGIAYKTGNPPNDPFFGYQWHLMDRGMTSGSATSNFGVQAPDAWTVSTGSGAVVAVVDTGVAYEDFGGFLRAPDLATTSFVAGYDFVNNDGHANDDEGHGTHVCGTIAGSTNNNLGVAGVAYNATIMPVKVLDSSGSGATSWVASGIRYAADNGAHVINLSLGSSFGSTVLEDAVNYAWSKGVVICAATGNSGRRSIGYPAAYPVCIAVGATRFDGGRPRYSQYGDGIDIAAPGGDTGVDQNGDGYGDGVLQQTFSGSPTNFGYYFFQGTSMATPHVAGVAALVKAAKPSATNAEIRAALESTCLDLGSAGYDTTYGHGLVDAKAAVDAISGGGGDTTPPADPTGLAATAGNGSVSLDWADNGDADLAGYHVYRSTTSSGPYSKINGSAVASSAYTDNGVSNGITYYYVVTAIDTSGNESGNSNEASATPTGGGGGDTTPPAAPTNLSSSSPGTGLVTLDWDDNGEADLAGYNVYQADSRNGAYTKINDALVTASAFALSGLPSRQRFYFVVTAVDTTGNESDQSNQTSQRVR